MAGQVKAAGSGVTRFAPGDEVYADLLYHGYGGFAGYAAAPADAMSLSRRPYRSRKRLQFRWRRQPHSRTFAAAENPARAEGPNRWRFRRRRHLLRSRSPRHAGPSDRRDQHPEIKLVRSPGADHVVDYTTTNFARGGRRYDLILDTVGRIHRLGPGIVADRDSSHGNRSRDRRFRAPGSLGPGPLHGAHFKFVMARCPAGWVTGAGFLQVTGAFLVLPGAASAVRARRGCPGSRVFIIVVSVSLILVPGDARATPR